MCISRPTYPHRYPQVFEVYQHTTRANTRTNRDMGTGIKLN